MIHPFAWEFCCAQIKVIDWTKYRRVHEELMKQLDKRENDCLPQVALNTTEVILQPVKFMQPQHTTLRINNTGQVGVLLEQHRPGGCVARTTQGRWVCCYNNTGQVGVLLQQHR